MLKQLACFALLVLVLTGTTSAQAAPLEPIADADWAAAIGEKPRTLSSEELARISTQLLARGQAEPSIKLIVMGLAVSEKASALSQDADASNANTAARKEVQLALSRIGVPEAAVPDAVRSLEQWLARTKGVVLSVKPSGASTSSRPKATPADVTKIRQAVRAALIDPDSAKYGELTLVRNDRACQAVNARNRFGGYAGEQQAAVVRAGSSPWVTTNMMDVSHSQCVEILEKLN